MRQRKFSRKSNSSTGREEMSGRRKLGEKSGRPDVLLTQ